MLLMAVPQHYTAVAHSAYLGCSMLPACCHSFLELPKQCQYAVLSSSIDSAFSGIWFLDQVGACVQVLCGSQLSGTVQQRGEDSFPGAHDAALACCCCAGSSAEL